MSNQAAPHIKEQGQKVYSVDELAEFLDVSTKTIHRWRKRGLVARKFIFEDGENRIGFLESSVKQFLDANGTIIAKAKKFARLTNKEKQQIIKEAAKLAVNGQMSPHQIIVHLALKTARAVETVRYVIMGYEKAHPDKPVFGGYRGVISPSQSGEIYKLYRQGVKIKDLTGRFNRNASSIHRIINQHRAKNLFARKIEFIVSKEFGEQGAAGKIIAEPFGVTAQAELKSDELLRPMGGSLTTYLQALKNLKPLDREREIRLFRRYNYLKYAASTLRAEIKLSLASGTKLGRIEKYLAEAEAVKKVIIEANLRLVVSIAGRHTAKGANLADLISEGNFSLMRAVEKFDYTRGFRFGTYASLAIAKDFARRIPAESARPDKSSAASLDNVSHNFRDTEAVGVAAIERTRKSLIQSIRNNLDQREQFIILNHFGLADTPVKDKKTLEQIGLELNLTKERVRQIELLALQKLRQSLSIEEFELLTG